MPQPVTEAVYWSLMMDCWPSEAGKERFGLTSQENYFALKWEVQQGRISIEQLERAMGRGSFLDGLISRDNPLSGVRFATPWDHLDRPPQQTDYEEARERRRASELRESYRSRSVERDRELEP